MNKLISILMLGMIGCASNQPVATRMVIECDYKNTVSSKVPFTGGSKKDHSYTCIQVPAQNQPKSEPLQAPAELVN